MGVNSTKMAHTDLIASHMPMLEVRIRTMRVIMALRFMVVQVAV